MRRSIRAFSFAAPVVLLLAGASTFPLFARQASQAALKSSPLSPPWAITLGTDEPFYAVGDTAAVDFRLTNVTGQDAYGMTLSTGGNGCQYRVRILDASGNTVWQPGTVHGGQFFNHGCLFAQRPVPLPHPTVLETKLSIPLVYQNAGGIGVLGTPLAAGPYQVCVDVVFIGPQRSPDFEVPPGANYSACVPIQIEL